MTRVKRFFVIGGVMVGLILGGFATRMFFVSHEPRVSEQDKINVTASFYPLAEVASRIGGDLVEVTNLTPAGVEPHEYELTPQDLVTLYASDLVLLNGRGLDAWGDKLLDPLHAKNIQTIRMTDSIGGSDPHIWLDPTHMEQQADLVAAKLTELDPIHALQFQAQRDAYKAELEALDRAYRTELASCATREVVTTHDAFGYLARRYDLSITHILGLSPEDDPSAAHMAEVASLAKRKKIKTIFLEPLVDPRLANTLAREVGARTSVLNPIEGLTEAEAREGKTYVQLMRENLERLRTALECVTAPASTITTSSTTRS